MRKVRATEVPVGYVLITTDEYADLVAAKATQDLQEEVKYEKDRGDKFRDKSWELESKIKELQKQIGGGSDGTKND
jgi:predicted  nucleic acid-binding Zn-ribbon protein